MTFFTWAERFAGKPSIGRAFGRQSTVPTATEWQRSAGSWKHLCNYADRFRFIGAAHSAETFNHMQMINIQMTANFFPRLIGEVAESGYADRFMYGCLSTRFHLSRPISNIEKNGRFYIFVWVDRIIPNARLCIIRLSVLDVSNSNLLPP